MQRNDGVIVHGSDFRGAGSVIIGQDLRVRIDSAISGVESTQTTELHRAVSDLMKAVELHALASDSPRAVVEQAATIGEELAKPNPERGRLLRMLDTLTSMASGVTAISGAAEAVRLLVTHLH